MVIFTLHPLRYRGAQFRQGLKTHFLGKPVVQRRRNGFAELLNRYIKCGFLAGQVGGPIIGRKRHGNCPVVVRLGANQLFREARDESGPTDIDVDISGGTALERHVINLAKKIDGQHVAIRGTGMLATGGQILLGQFGQIPCAGCQLGQSLVDCLIGHDGLDPREVEGAEIRQCDVGKQFHFHLEFKVLGTCTTDGISTDEVHLGLHRRPQAPLFQHLAGCVVDRLFQNLGGHSAAVALPYDR